MNTDTEPAATIVAEDVKAFKESEYIVLFYRPDLAEGPPWGIRLGREVRFDDTVALRLLAQIARAQVWKQTSADAHAVTFQRVIAADPAHCQAVMHKAGPAQNCVWLGYTKYGQPHLRTALNAIRPGDAIGIHFEGSNNTQNHDNAGLHADACFLRVIRKGKLVGEFLLAVEVAPNGAGRMVRS